MARQSSELFTTRSNSDSAVSQIHPIFLAFVTEDYRSCRLPRSELLLCSAEPENELGDEVLLANRGVLCSGGSACVESRNKNGAAQSRSVSEKDRRSMKLPLCMPLPRADTHGSERRIDSHSHLSPNTEI